MGLLDEHFLGIVSQYRARLEKLIEECLSKSKTTAEAYERMTKGLEASGFRYEETTGGRMARDKRKFFNGEISFMVSLVSMSKNSEYISLDKHISLNLRVTQEMKEMRKAIEKFPYRFEFIRREDNGDLIYWMPMFDWSKVLSGNIVSKDGIKGRDGRKVDMYANPSMRRRVDRG